MTKRSERPKAMLSKLRRIVQARQTRQNMEQVLEGGPLSGHSRGRRGHPTNVLNKRRRKKELETTSRKGNR